MASARPPGCSEVARAAGPVSRRRGRARPPSRRHARAARRRTRAARPDPVSLLLHMTTEADRLRALRAAQAPRPRGTARLRRLRPSREDVEDTNGRWLGGRLGIFERADWDEERRAALSVRRGEEWSTMHTRLALAGGVAAPARSGGLRDRGGMGLVRPRAVHRGRRRRLRGGPSGRVESAHALGV